LYQQARSQLHSGPHGTRTIKINPIKRRGLNEALEAARWRGNKAAQKQSPRFSGLSGVREGGRNRPQQRSVFPTDLHLKTLQTLTSQPLPVLGQSRTGGGGRDFDGGEGSCFGIPKNYPEI
jgi:hypothetical protein